MLTSGVQLEHACTWGRREHAGQATALVKLARSHATELLITTVYGASIAARTFPPTSILSFTTGKLIIIARILCHAVFAHWACSQAELAGE